MTQYAGEIISLFVALSWTATALFADIASHRIGALPLNLIRMVLSLLMLGALLWVTVGNPYPVYADASTWFWLALSGLVGYVFGDFCLFNSYVIFGSRYGQLFMTLAPPLAGIAGWLMLGEKMPLHSWFAMLVTLAGIASTLMALTPVLIIVPYAIINHQRITFKEVFGTLVTIAGVAMFFLLG